MDAVVATLHVTCDEPIAVVNIVTVGMQTYPAEVGVGAPCTAVSDELSFCARVVDTGTSLTVGDASTHPVYSQNPWCGPEPSEPTPGSLCWTTGS